MNIAYLRYKHSVHDARTLRPVAYLVPAVGTYVPTVADLAILVLKVEISRKFYIMISSVSNSYLVGIYVQTESRLLNPISNSGALQM